MKNLLLIAVLLASALPSVAATDRALWKMPQGGILKDLRLRPDGKIGVYWTNEDEYLVVHKHCSLIKENLRQRVRGGLSKSISYRANNETNIQFETFNLGGQHAYLPMGEEFLRLKSGKGYRVLKNLPRFIYSQLDDGTLQDLKFSLDGEVLKVLGQDKLWIIGAQTGKLLRVIRPLQGKWWSRENAVLSPDGFKILGMREKMVLFSARSGHLLTTYGIYTKSFLGHEVELHGHVSFSPDGKRTCAFKETMNSVGKTYEYPAKGGALIWKGTIPEPEFLRSSPDGRFYIDEVFDPHLGSYPVAKSGRTHKVISKFADICLDKSSSDNAIEFSSDSKSIYWRSGGTLWQRTFKTS